jgi:hypothetical protein
MILFIFEVDYSDLRTAKHLFQLRPQPELLVIEGYSSKFNYHSNHIYNDLFILKSQASHTWISSDLEKISGLA